MEKNTQRQRQRQRPMTMTLMKRVHDLPTVLIDMIYEYCTDNRPVMKNICKELLTAYQYQLFHFTFDKYRCYCESHDDPYEPNTYIIKKFYGHYLTFCDSTCEAVKLFDLRKYVSRTGITIKPYKINIKRYLCLENDCSCWKCSEYKEFEKNRKEGVEPY